MSFPSLASAVASNQASAQVLGDAIRPKVYL
jgi:hypothetical protein